MKTTIIINPTQHRAAIVAAYVGGLIDPWDAWRDLYNSGARGAALNSFLRHPSRKLKEGDR